MSRHDATDRRAPIDRSGVAAVALLLAMLACSLATANEPRRLEVLSFQTRSGHGAEIARAFSRLLYLNSLEPRVSITVLETDTPHRGHSIRLQTPVRAISRHDFSPRRVRELASSDAIADAMLRDALDAGLLRAR